MKKRIACLVCGVSIFCFANFAQAVPMDLNGFGVIESQQGSVTEGGGVVDFAENMFDAALYYYNDNFDVDASATTLSFDYDFTLGQFDVGDYVQFNVNSSEQWYVEATGTGHVEFDLTAFQGTTISLDWALVWGGDWDATTTASISNIDVATAPVPEPATMLLFGSGLVGLYASNRKKDRKKEVT